MRASLDSAIFNRVSNKHAPLKILNIRNKSFTPWITSGMKSSMKTCDKFYKNWLLTHDLTWYNKQKLYWDKVVSINKYYHELYYNSVLTNSDNTKKMWDNIKYIINKKRPKSHIKEISLNDKQYRQPFLIASAMNNCFCNVASDLPTSPPKSNCHNKSKLTHLNQ